MATSATSENHVRIGAPRMAHPLKTAPHVREIRR